MESPWAPSPDTTGATHRVGCVGGVSSGSWTLPAKSRGALPADRPRISQPVAGRIAHLTEARIALTEVMRIGNRARVASEIAAKVGRADAQRVLSILTDSSDVESERRAIADLVLHADVAQQALTVLDRVTK